MKHATGVLRILALLAAAVGALWADATDVQPALFFKARQALWMNGRYYVQATFVMTLCTILSVIVVPVLLAMALRALLRSRRRSTPEHLRATTRRAREQVSFVGGAVLLVWALLTAVSVVGPELSGFGGYLMILGLLGVSSGLPVGMCALLDGLLPPACVQGPIESMEILRTEHMELHCLDVAGERHHVSPTTYGEHRVGMVVTIVQSALLGRVLALSTAPTGYRNH